MLDIYILHSFGVTSMMGVYPFSTHKIRNELENRFEDINGVTEAIDQTCGLVRSQLLHDRTGAITVIA